MAPGIFMPPKEISIYRPLCGSGRTLWQAQKD